MPEWFSLLVVVTHFAVVAGGAGLTVGHVALLDFGVDDPVVGAFEPLGDTAPQKGQGIPEHGAAGGDAIEGVDAGEAVGAGGEAAQEMAQQRLVVVLTQDVEHEAVAHLHQGLDGPVLGHGHGDPRRIEAGLADPAGHHGAAAGCLPVVLARGHHVEPAREAAEGPIQVAIEAFHGRDRFGLGEQLAQVGAGLFAALVVAALGDLADPQGIKGLLLAEAAQLVGHGVDWHVVAAEGVVTGNPLLRLQAGQQGADGGLQVGVGLGGPGGHHHGAGLADQGRQFLGIGGPQVHQLHLGFGLADAAGNRLAEAVTEAVLA